MVADFHDHGSGAGLEDRASVRHRRADGVVLLLLDPLREEPKRHFVRLWPVHRRERNLAYVGPFDRSEVSSILVPTPPCVLFRYSRSVARPSVVIFSEP